MPNVPHCKNSFVFQHEREDRDRDAPTDVESGNPKRNRSIWYEIFRIFLQAFTLTFLAEWGDRSQLTTIILGAREVCMNFSKHAFGQRNFIAEKGTRSTRKDLTFNKINAQFLLKSPGYLFMRY